VKSKLRIFVVGVVAAVAATTAMVPADAVTQPQFAYGGSAGGTQITAIGTTISSSATAQSTVFAMQPGQDTNKVLTVNAAPLATAGVITTDVTGTAQDDGFKVVSHARAADLSLLNGLIKVQAIDTTSTASSSHGSPAAGDTNSQFLGLIINGTKYPVDIAKNTGITIPGIASVAINWSRTAIDGGSVVTMGGGLAITLLGQLGSAAAGATIIVNPTYSVVEPSNPNNPNAPSLGGGAFGAYAESHVGDAVKAETGRLAYFAVPIAGTNGNTLNNHLAAANVGSLFNLGALDSDVYGVSTASYAKVTASNKIANVNVFQQFLFGGLIQATALGSTSQVEMVDNNFTMGGTFQFVNLRIAGQQIPIDVAPNTTIHVANLGTVTINERKSVAVPGFVHGYQVTGLHIVLDTAGYGLPVGADVELAVSQALVWR